MKRALLAALLLASTGILPAAAPREIIVAAGETRAAAVNAFKARVEIRGRLDESLFLVGGSLRLGGEVSGDVICVAADVEIGPGAVIGRDLIVLGGRLRRAGDSRVAGRVYDIRSREGLRQVTASLIPFLPESGGMTFFKVIKIFFWLILALLALAVFPAQVAQASGMLPRAPLRHLGRGLAALLLFLVLLLAFLLLSFLLIGIPLLIVLLAAYFLGLIFGRAAVFHFVGERACRFLRISAGPAFFIVLGAAVYTACKFTPYAGGILLALMDLLAVGVAAGFFLRRRRASS
ncbi:MAG TPA: hypothetical protein PK919_11495 [Candidatus Aminicenantes bacterium]|nr:hypothetical protein [Candidatus Aminicenantes bacterium]